MAAATARKEKVTAAAAAAAAEERAARRPTTRLLRSHSALIDCKLLALAACTSKRCWLPISIVAHSKCAWSCLSVVPLRRSARALACCSCSHWCLLSWLSTAQSAVRRLSFGSSMTSEARRHAAVMQTLEEQLNVSPVCPGFAECCPLSLPMLVGCRVPSSCQLGLRLLLVLLVPPLSLVILALPNSPLLVVP